MRWLSEAMRKEKKILAEAAVRRSESNYKSGEAAWNNTLLDFSNIRYVRLSGCYWDHTLLYIWLEVLVICGALVLLRVMRVPHAVDNSPAKIE